MLPAFLKVLDGTQNDIYPRTWISYGPKPEFMSCDELIGVYGWLQAKVFDCQLQK